MASEYIKYQLKDVKPPEPEKPLTKREKVRNWIDYNKWYVVIGVVLIIICIDLAYSSLTTVRNTPDIQIAYIGSHRLPDDTVRAFEEAASVYAEDTTGNKKAEVALVQYVTNTEDEGNEAIAGNNQASVVRLMGDLESCDSLFFLLEDPNLFDEQYAILDPLPDGRRALPFSDVSGLAAADYGTYEEIVAGTTVCGDSRELLDSLYLARRLPREGMNEKRLAAADTFWDRLCG